MEFIPDNFYVEKIQAGEIDHFSVLLNRYSRLVFSLIVKIVENREDAEELTQDVFLKAFRSISSFKGNSLFSTWLYRIAYNTAISAVRKKKKEWQILDESLVENISEEEAGETLSSLGNEEQLARLERALDQLSVDDRALILLFYMQGKTVEELTIITGYSLSNVKTKLHRIRKKILTLMLTA